MRHAIKYDFMLSKTRVDDSNSIPVVAANVSNPPTTTEINTAIGTAAAVGSGFISMIDDNNSNICYLVFSNGTDWFYSEYTKAT